MRKIYTFIVIILAAHQLQAQQSMTLYNMQHIPQRRDLNPAFPVNGTATVGLPLLSSVYLNVSNSAFKYTDFVRRGTDDSLFLDAANIISKMKDKGNFISTALNIDMLTFGFKIKKNFIGFGATEKINMQFDYPKNMMEFLWKGNGATIGKTADLEFGVNFTHYREYSLIYSRTVNDRFSFGMKLKYLYGMENVSTNHSSVSLYTDPYSLAITAKSDIHVNTSGIEENTFDNFNSNEYAFGRKNTGYAADFGITYALSKKLLVSASVLDIGKITWNSHVVNYRSDKENGEFTYNGIDLSRFVSNTSGTNDVWQHLLDTLTSTFKVNSKHISYETKLPRQFYIGGNYLLNLKNTLGIVVHGQRFENITHTDYTLSFNKTVKKWLNVAVSCSAINNTYNNFGLGLALKMGASQIYLVSDNVYGIFYPTRAQTVNFRTGINFIFDKKTKPKKEKLVEVKEIKEEKK